MSEEKTDYYFLKNSTTKMFFTGFSKHTINKPTWTSDIDDAIAYSEMTALALQRRLENLYMPAQKILLVEKTE